MKKDEKFYPNSSLASSYGITMRDKLAHDYLCAFISSTILLKDTKDYIKIAYELADSFINESNKNESNKNGSK